MSAGRLVFLVRADGLDGIADLPRGCWMIRRELQEEQQHITKIIADRTNWLGGSTLQSHGSQICAQTGA